MKNNESMFILRFLRWFCPAHLYESIVGDLLEEFEMDIQESGRRRARWKLTRNVIRFLRPGIIFRNRFSLNSHGMIQNHFKIAWRTTLRNKSNTVINILGMTCGLGVAMMLLFIVRFEYSFDNFHAKADRLYQVKTYDRYDNNVNSQTPQGAIYALQKQFTEVEHAAVVYGWTPSVIRVDGKNIQQKNNFFIHPEFLEMIDVTWVKGSVSTSLHDVYQVVLDEPTAQKLFPGNDPLGQVIHYDNKMDLTVSGVIKKMPENSAFPMQVIMSYETLKKYMDNYAEEDYWGGGDSWFHGYVLLRPGASKIAVEERLTELSRKQGNRSEIGRFELSPLKQSHFDTQTDVFNYAVPEWIMHVFVGVAIFLIAIACINFINLSTAQAVQRSREIGLRKIMGANRPSVAFQFFAETFILVSISVLLGCVVTMELLRYADHFFLTKIYLTNPWDGEAVFYIILLTIFVTFLAGFYPALILSGFSPLRSFKNLFSGGKENSVSLRRSLVVIQFVIAQVLVICMMIGASQVDFFYKTNHGFVTDNIVSTNIPFKDSVVLRDRLKNELLLHPEIKDITFSLTQPTSNRNWWWSQVKGTTVLPENTTFRLQWVDKNFFDFYEIPMQAGRNFDATDSLPVAIVNEEAVRIANLKNPEDIVGHELSYWGRKVKVIGVVKNYYSQSLKSEIVPHLYLNEGWNFSMAQIKIDPLHKAEAVALVERTWKNIHPDNYFEYEYMNDTIGEFYANERKFSNFIQLFTITGMIIGCLGLYGLVSFVCTKRTKEISIRKILGATIMNVMSIISQEFLILLSIAIVIAAPLGWFLMNQYLQEYTYKIDIHWSVFVIAGVLTLLVAMVTIALKTIRTALVNPAESLKCQ